MPKLPRTIVTTSGVYDDYSVVGVYAIPDEKRLWDAHLRFTRTTPAPRLQRGGMIDDIVRSQNERARWHREYLASLEKEGAIVRMEWEEIHELDNALPLSPMRT